MDRYAGVRTNTDWGVGQDSKTTLPWCQFAQRVESLSVAQGAQESWACGWARSTHTRYVPVTAAMTEAMSNPPPMPIAAVRGRGCSGCHNGVVKSVKTPDAATQSRGRRDPGGGAGPGSGRRARRQLRVGDGRVRSEGHFGWVSLL